MVGGGGLCGSFLLFAAFALLLVATISSPVFNQISLLDIYNGGERTTFGVFGYCIGGQCTPRRLGYDISAVTGALSNTNFINDNLVRITRALVLIPIACGLAFIAFLVALASDRLGYIFASLITFFSFLVSLVSMALLYGLFIPVRNHVNNNGGAGVSSSLGNASWMVLAATVVLFFATFIVLFSCCTARRQQRGIGNHYEAGPARTPRTWYGRRKY